MFITDTALTKWIALRRGGTREELETILEDCRARKSGRVTDSGLVRYRIRKPVDAQLVLTRDGELVDVVPGWRGR
jgi:hypothetical protein